MEAVYFGNATTWGKGQGAGPWVMADMENGLFAGNTRENDNNTPLTSEFVTAMVKGGENGFALKGGDATQGSLKTMYNGARPNGYQPMKKCVPRNGTRPGRTRGQLTLICDPPRPPRFARPIHYPRRQGSIILGIGGDNSDSAVGTFYEGCGASASSFPPFSLPPLAHSLTRILSARPTTPLFHNPAVTQGLSTDAADDAVQANIVAAGYGK
jgi:hypothetical protein